MEYGQTAYNKMYMFTALFGRFRVQKLQSAQSAFVQFCSPTFFGLRKMLRIFLIANQKTSYTMER
jgi:hypothetical protein